MIHLSVEQHAFHGDGGLKYTWNLWEYLEVRSCAPITKQLYRVTGTIRIEAFKRPVDSFGLTPPGPWIRWGGTV